LAAEYEVEAHLFPFMAISLGDMGRAVDADAFAAAKGVCNRNRLSAVAINAMLGCYRRGSKPSYFMPIGEVMIL
jgi:hypothetical protein